MWHSGRPASQDLKHKIHIQSFTTLHGALNQMVPDTMNSMFSRQQKELEAAQLLFEQFVLLNQLISSHCINLQSWIRCHRVTLV